MSREPQDGQLDVYFQAQRERERSVAVDELRILRAVVGELAARRAPPVPVASPMRRRAALFVAAALVTAAASAVAATIGYRVGRSAPASGSPVMAREVRPPPVVDASAVLAPSTTAAPPPATEEVTPPRPPIRRESIDPEADLESLLITHARAAIRRGLPDEAQTVLGRHRREFSEGHLAEERDVLFIESYLLLEKRALGLAAVTEYRARGTTTAALRARVDELESQLRALP